MRLTNWINTKVRFPNDYIVLVVLFAIIYLGYFLLKKENPRLQVLGGIIIVGLILSILLLGMGAWIMQGLT